MPFAALRAVPAVLLLSLSLLAGCQGNSSAGASTSSDAGTSGTTPTATGGGTTFGTGGTTTTATYPAFDGADAYGLLTAQCNFGVRPPNTAAHDQCQQYIMTNLKPYVDKMDTQVFTFQDTSRNVTLNLTNIIGVINPSGAKKVMLFTHWDTRPTADQELDAANKKKPILGADDGASGTAVLLELAKIFHAKNPNVCVELLFVDGEDWGPGDDKMYLGAKHFAAAPGTYKPDYALLLDMIGYSNQTVYREITSQNSYPALNDKVFNAAAALGYGGNFINSTKWQITDDHDSFIAAGIPTIDLINFDFPYWHTLQDTADKCSAASLKICGDVMVKVVYDEVPTALKAGAKKTP